MSNKEQGMTAIPPLLIIEDNFICQRIYVAALRDYYPVELASNAEEALERLAEQAYQCIISDLGLPDRPGIELLPIIRNSTLNQHTPIVVISAHMSEELKQICLQLGADKVCVKPITAVVLREIIATLTRDQVF
ncbi:TPA: response regulator [Legionella feeleii]|uniref:Sensory histidine-kinase / response regulator n=1 Tax=Legionella feeleii TaxID=453 RepID=A0A378IVV4_9GAMM|nr:response regulator [Legionella feeleii]STX39050.1 sensory histidine-kinase / response regulator [Legionella feeleii]